ncbi:MAG: hypothetical protein SWX82_32340 [Cyanobacteriota bacterium]|nr:hypothetical protein [Cyanobacteriota bacterium]
MDIFVRSRGVEPKTDYTWVKVTETAQEAVDNFPDLFQDESTSLIYSEKQSVVLSRRNGKLLLLITAIQPAGRGDFYKRQIRISVGWIDEDSADNEEAFRLLAARALDDEENPELTVEIAEAIPLGGIYGFEADFNKLLGLIASCQIKHKVDSQQLTEQEEKFNKLAQISPEVKQSLVQRIRQFQLPKREGVLVLFTTNKREGTLRQAEVWRGISSLVESPHWKAYYPFPDPIPAEIAEGLNYEFTVFKLLKRINSSWGNWLIDSMESQVNQKLESNQ